jgi:hypothetical protein
MVYKPYVNFLDKTPEEVIAILRRNATTRLLAEEMEEQLLEFLKAYGFTKQTIIDDLESYRDFISLETQLDLWERYNDGLQAERNLHKIAQRGILRRSACPYSDLVYAKFAVSTLFCSYINTANLFQFPLLSIEYKKEKIGELRLLCKEYFNETD